LKLLPDEIGELSAMRNLNLSDNQLLNLPETLGKLHKLKRINISNNSVQSLGSWIGELKVLKVANFSRNQIKSVPPEIGRLHTLRDFDISENPITMLPEELSWLEGIETLNLFNCPLIRDIPIPTRAEIPSLIELTARVLIRHAIPTSKCGFLIREGYINRASQCTLCNGTLIIILGPYIDFFESRVRFVFKEDQFIPLESRLCTNHYETDAERIMRLFQEEPATAPLMNQYVARSRSSSFASERSSTGIRLARSPSVPSLSTNPNRRLPTDRLVRRLSTLSNISAFGARSRSLTSNNME
jgi:Leucine-rich repeat (LRR) protein